VGGEKRGRERAAKKVKGGERGRESQFRAEARDHSFIITSILEVSSPGGEVGEEGGKEGSWRENIMLSWSSSSSPSPSPSPLSSLAYKM